ncbi:hypothetical protein K883_05125 [Mycobacterium sp. TKK-01-0059]|nr:hypothetical protein K883_05125 [Mycobacterium sp. TKK-01-0059]
MKLNMETCLAFAKNEQIPLRFRVAFLAYSKTRTNGHASFAKGELAETLKAHPVSVSRAIAGAKDAGLLMYESTSRCLVSPKDVVTGGWKGHPNDPCAVCDGKRSRGVRNLTETVKE